MDPANTPNALPAAPQPSKEDEGIAAAVVGRAGAAGRERLVQSQQQRAFEAALNAPQRRYEGEVQRGHPALPEHSFIAEPGRYNRPGELGLDTTENRHPLGANNERYSGWPNQTLETNRFSGYIVDATDLPGVSRGALTEPYGDGGAGRTLLSRLTGEAPYYHTRAVSDGARQQGAEGVRAPAVHGGTDLTLFPENSERFHDQFQPVAPADLPDPLPPPPVAQPERYSNQRYAYPEADLRPGSHSISNEAIRQRYEEINKGVLPELVQQWQGGGEMNLRQQAEAASAVRHENRLESRGLMGSREEIRGLQNRDMGKSGHPDGPTFAQTLTKDPGVVGDEALRAVIDSASRTSTEYNARLGVVGPSASGGALDNLARADADAHSRAGGARYGAVGAGVVSAIANLADGEVTLDDAGRIAADMALGAGTGALDDLLTPRLGGNIRGAAASGAIIDGVVSGVTSTWANADAYERGEVSAGEATADVAVDTGVGIASGMAGMAAGAAIGSAIPVAGTAVGAVVGFGVGMAASMGTNALLEGSGAADWAREGLGDFLEDNFEQPLASAWDSISSAQSVIREGISDAASSVARWLGW